ncbi:hypothetical protein ANO11243_062760 [Dothideomycetidae sp. 11243]|nr:hypothetical protein ANO11243_062760 [fungal sp. No.11243]
MHKVSARRMDKRTTFQWWASAAPPESSNRRVAVRRVRKVCEEVIIQPTPRRQNNDARRASHCTNTRTRPPPDRPAVRWKSKRQSGNPCRPRVITILMTLRPLNLTTALRPSLLPDEVLLFVQDSVGLYRDKFKIEGHQDGHAYLTSHRICYVDNEEPRQRSVAISLKDVDYPDFYVRDRHPHGRIYFKQTLTQSGRVSQVFPQDNLISKGKPD